MKRAGAGVERALFWALALAAFAAAAAGLLSRAIDRVAANYDIGRSAYAIVRVIAPEGHDGVARAAAILQSAPHVDSAAPMTAGRAAALLGMEASADIPALRLIEIELAQSPPGADVAGDIIAALAQGGVTAEVVGAPDDSGGAGLGGRIRNLAFWGAIGFGLIMALIVSFSARGLAGRRREMVTVMTDLGATGAQAAGRVADEAAMLGLFAGAAGCALAGALGVVAILLTTPEASLEALPRLIRPLDLAPLAAVTLGSAIAAGIGARTAALSFHERAAKIG
jgi:hypothetical protein